MARKRYSSLVAYGWFGKLIGNEIRRTEKNLADSRKVLKDGFELADLRKHCEESVKTQEFYLDILKESYRQTMGEPYKTNAKGKAK